ncbi:MAG: Mth938-like domain-containing protein [Paracoccaceae bacterium]|nr:Mth938-like domain-containing protein [Paracoccaceae bacterium]
MHLHEISFPSARPIDGYGPGFFRIDGKVHRGAALVTAGGISRWEGLEDTAALLALAGEVDVIILGTGPQIAHPPAALRKALEDAGLGVEPMGTPAACRTYNVLLSEGRRIAAVLLPI